jgi:CRISPR/Cas system CSM-associated protein Csm2 small subunit
VEGYAVEQQFEQMWKNVERMYKEGVYPDARTWGMVERVLKEKEGVWDQWKHKVERMKETIAQDKERKLQERKKQDASLRASKPRQYKAPRVGTARPRHSRSKQD